MTNGEAAAWVQAIGSILAIMSAVGLMLWQHHLERQTNERAAKLLKSQRIQAIGALAKAMLEQLDLLRDVFKRHSKHDMSPTELVVDDKIADLEALWRLASQMNVGDIEDAEFWRSWARFIAAVEIALERLSYWKSPDESGSGLEDRIIHRPRAEFALARALGAAAGLEYWITWYGVPESARPIISSPFPP